MFGLDEQKCPTLRDLQERFDDPSIVHGVRDLAGRVGCSTWFLPRLVGISQALEWAYIAEPVDVSVAAKTGLVKAVVAREHLLTEAHALARRFTEGRSAIATALPRQMMYRNMAQAHPADAHRIESLAVFHLSKNDGKEGAAAFREKQAAKFTSRISRDLPPFYAEWIAAHERT